MRAPIVTFVAVVPRGDHQRVRSCKYGPDTRHGRKVYIENDTFLLIPPGLLPSRVLPPSPSIAGAANGKIPLG